MMHNAKLSTQNTRHVTPGAFQWALAGMSVASYAMQLFGLLPERRSVHIKFVHNSLAVMQGVVTEPCSTQLALLGEEGMSAFKRSDL